MYGIGLRPIGHILFYIFISSSFLNLIFHFVSEWIAFGWMVLIFFGFRVMVLFFMFHPVDRLTAKFNKRWSGGLEEHILAGMLSLRRIEGSLTFIYT